MTYQKQASAMTDVQQSSTNEFVSSNRSRIPKFYDTFEDTDYEKRARIARRKERKKSKPAVQQVRTQLNGETANPHEVEEGDGDGPQAHQKGFYTGNKKKLVELAVSKFKIYLLNVNAFPSNEELREWTKKLYVSAGRDLFGEGYQGEGYDVL